MVLHRTDFSFGLFIHVIQRPMPLIFDIYDFFAFFTSRRDFITSMKTSRFLVKKNVFFVLMRGDLLLIKRRARHEISNWETTIFSKIGIFPDKSTFFTKLWLFFKKTDVFHENCRPFAIKVDLFQFCLWKFTGFLDNWPNTPLQSRDFPWKASIFLKILSSHLLISRERCLHEERTKCNM